MTAEQVSVVAPVVKPGNVAAAAGQGVDLAEHSDGSVSGRFELDAVGGEKVKVALESFVQADRPAGDTRTRAQQSGDAFVQLADIAPASGKLPVLQRSSRPWRW